MLGFSSGVLEVLIFFRSILRGSLEAPLLSELLQLSGDMLQRPEHYRDASA